ncbi:hypothetical protein FQR65_LT15728 [Abscondita terminalis]|nr:hypothetical protein FQR65_LT15728 [Abscondita terminalis]
MERLLQIRSECNVDGIIGMGIIFSGENVLIITVSFDNYDNFNDPTWQLSASTKSESSGCSKEYVAGELVLSSFVTKPVYKKTCCAFYEAMIVSQHFARHLRQHHMDKSMIKLLMDTQSKDCKQKWKTLRDSYKRAIGSRRHKSGQAAKKVRLWKFEREMSFLEKYVHTETKTKTNVADVEEESDNEVTETVKDSEPSILQEDSVQSPTELMENYNDTDSPTNSNHSSGKKSLKT